MMKRLMLFVVLFVNVAVSASEVKWNFVNAKHYPAGETGLEETLKSDGMSWVGFSLFFTASTSGKNVALSDFTCNLATAITWVSMSAEDIVCSSAFGNGIPSLFSTEYSGATGEFHAKAGNPFYLAFQVFELVEDIGGISRGEAYYGWVEFCVSDTAEVMLLASAVDLGGGAMLVGGGSAATPKPSAGMLLLIGFAVLPLRRRCNALKSDR